MKVFVIGSGGREHALIWKIARSKRVKRIFCAPGNGGMGTIAQTAAIPHDDIRGLLSFAKKEKIDLTVVGPEAPLVGGIVDTFTQAGLKIFGPTKELARLEGSKIYAKECMKRFDVPTADFAVFEKSNAALAYLDKCTAPIVVKADGLCAGKGVMVCSTIEEAKAAVQKALEDNVFGDAGRRILIEACLEGEEASIIVIADGRDTVVLASSQDHKRVFDADKGPNTGGMGAYSPAPVVTEAVFEACKRRILFPMIKGLAAEGRPFKGVLYAGIMVTEKGPEVLEFNVRFGDPETQAILPRLKSDLVDLMERSIDGTLAAAEVVWDERPCVSVVMASGGYPGKYEKGKTIIGLEEAGALNDVVVFHAGTKIIEDTDGTKRCVTEGGRVLNVTALGESIKESIERCYSAVGKIRFDQAHYRKDIGKRALQRLSRTKSEGIGCAR